MSFRRRFFPALWLAFFSTFPGYALDPATSPDQCARTVRTRLNGLPRNAVSALIQSRDGYLWVGTGGGVSRYDGVRFVTADTRNTPELDSSFVTALCEDAGGAVWIGTLTGGVVRYFNGAMARVETPAAFEAVTTLAPAKAGGVWIGTEKGVFRSRELRVEEVPALAPLRAMKVTSLCEDNDGALWVGTRAPALYRFAGGTLRNLQEFGFPAVVTTAIRRSAEGVVWLGTDGGGLIRWSRGRLTQYTEKEGLSADKVTAVETEGNGAVWAATADGKLNRLTMDGWSSVALTGGAVANCLLLDAQGSLWAGTVADGMVRFSDTAVVRYGRETAASGPLRCVCAGPENSVVGIFRDGGVFRFGPGETATPLALEGLDGREALTLFEDGESALWIGFSNARILRIQGAQQTLYTTADGLPEGDVRVIGRDAQGTLWAGVGPCLARYNEGRFSALPVADAARGERVRAFCTVPGGALWIGTDRGVITLQQGSFGILSGQNVPRAFSVRDMLSDEAGTVWIATGEHGLLAVGRGKVQRFTARDGLPGDAIDKILTDNAGNLWLAGDGGVFRVSRKALETAPDKGKALVGTVLDERDGLPGPIVSGEGYPATCRTDDGRLWFATRGGLCVFDPQRRPTVFPRLPVVLESVQVGSTFLAAVPPLEINTAAGAVEFRFTAPDFDDPDGVRFRYRLEGVDPEWVEAGNNRLARYNDIHPGSYIFRVQAARRNGPWEEPGAALPLTVSGRFFHSPWFQAACGVLVVLLLALGQTRRRRRQKEALAELKQQVDERTAGMEKAYEKARLEQELARQRAEEITTLKERLETHGHLDILTGATNRKHFMHLLEQNWRRGCRVASPLTLILVDIDGFRHYNERYGAEKGDQTLQKIAEVLRENLHRVGDVAARYGGGRFAVLLPDTGREGAEILSERLRLSVEMLRLPHEGAGGTVTASIGTAVLLPQAGTSHVGLLNLADDALEQAREKKGGGLVVLDAVRRQEP